MGLVMRRGGLLAQGRPETSARCLIDNAQWPSACQQGTSVDAGTYATLGSGYRQLLGEMPHEPALFDPGHLAH